MSGRLLALSAHQERHQVLRTLRIRVDVLLLLLWLQMRRKQVRRRHADVLELLLLLLLAGELLRLHLRDGGRLTVVPTGAAHTAAHAVPNAHASGTEVEQLCLGMLRAQIHSIPGAHAS